MKANFGKLPLSFEANQGQTDRRVKFLSRGQGYSLFLTGREAVLALHKNGLQPIHERGGKPTLPPNGGKTDIVRMGLAGASQGLRVAGDEPLPGKSNYFLGSDPAKWHTNVPTYSKVKYSGVYPGIDLVYYGNQQQLEYDFVIAPNADPKQARLHFAGASKLKLNHDGDLEIIAKDGEIAFHKPVVYQMKDGQRQPVDGNFKLLAKNIVGFELGSYDRSRELVVDPVLAYSTYLGGTEAEFARAIAVDQHANVYVTGQNFSSDFPLSKHALDTTSNSVYLTKLNQTGTAIDYSTYFVSDCCNEVRAYGLAVDASGNAYLTGAAEEGFPTTSGAFQTVSKQKVGFYTGFVAKVNATGSGLVYATYLGGSGGDSTYIGYDSGQAIAVDSAGDAYVTGHTDSADFPVTKGAYQSTNKSGLSAFVTKLNPEGTGLVYSTFLGGTSIAPQGDVPADMGYAIALNSSGEAYVGGSTVLTAFPTTPDAFQTVSPSKGSFGSSGFVAKLNAAGSELVFSTFLGGSNPVYENNGEPGDIVFGIAVDPQGNVLAAGEASSTDFPVTSNAIQSTNESSLNGFVAKLNPIGSALVYSTYLGGTDPENEGRPGAVVAGVAVDKQGDAFVTGHTIATDFPVTSGAIQEHNHGAGRKSSNAFLTELDPGGSLVYSTYFGGSSYFPEYSDAGEDGDGATAVSLDSLGNAYITGGTISSDFPVTPGRVSNAVPRRLLIFTV